MATSQRKLHPALQAVVGMWKERTALPADGAKVSRLLRQRLMRRN